MERLPPSYWRLLSALGRAGRCVPGPAEEPQPGTLAEAEERADLEALLKRALKSHTPKLDQVRYVLELVLNFRSAIYAALLDEDSEWEVEDLAKDLNQAKQDGLYVDIEDGIVKKPSVVITSERAALVLVKVRAAVEAVTPNQVGGHQDPAKPRRWETGERLRHVRCCISLLYASKEATSRSWEVAFELGWSLGDSNS
ncbi:AbiV family abortive infection protein [Sphaerisporangium sp. NPDC004334]